MVKIKNLGRWAFVYFRNRNTDIVFLVPLGPVEHVHLRVPFVAIRNKEVNISAVVWPSQLGTLTYFWWFGNSTKVWPLSISICLDLTLSDWYLLRCSHVLTSAWCWDHRGMCAITDKLGIHGNEYDIPSHTKFIAMTRELQIILRKKRLYKPGCSRSSDQFF